MLKVNPERITWFLGLQRILRFPRSVMAPSANVRVGRKAATNGLSTDLGRPASQTMTRWRPKSGVMLAASTNLDQIKSQLNRPAAAGVRRPVVHATSTPHIGSKKFMLQRAPNTSEAASTAFQKYTSPQTLAKQEPSFLEESHRRIGGFSSARSYPRQSVALAPIHVSSAPQISQVLELDQRSRPTASDADRSLLAGRALRFTGRPSLERDPDAQSRVLSLDRDATTGDDQPPRGRPTFSTLHVDGSALGRWAVEHLERALGKPATGMTGVDPRASVPRNRVAPF